MARLQDYPSVTPNTANDSLLIVQSAGQGNAKIDTVGQKIATDTTHSGLTTTSKKLVGAINELNSGKVDKSAISSLITLGGKSGSIASFSTDIADKLFSCYVNVTAQQAGSGTPAPDNVRAISGWSACNLSATGKNMWSNKFSDYTHPDDYYILPIPLEFGKTYTAFATLKSTTVKNIYLAYVKDGDRYGNFVGLTPIINSSGTVYTRQIIVDDTFTNPKLVFYGNETTFNQVFANFNIQLELGNQATTYEPYNGTTHTFPFGQTVYGGVLDVLSGVVESELDLITYDGSSDENWQKNGEYFYVPVSSDNQVSFTVISNQYQGMEPIHYSAVPNGYMALGSGGYNYLNIHDNSYATLEDFKTALSNTNLQVLYKKVTPITIQLTPTEVKTILGSNNIFADCGDIDLKYLETIGNRIA